MAGNGCCARAASDQVKKAFPRILMNSRRLMGCPGRGLQTLAHRGERVRRCAIQQNQRPEVRIGSTTEVTASHLRHFPFALMCGRVRRETGGR